MELLQLKDSRTQYTLAPRTLLDGKRVLGVSGPLWTPELLLHRDSRLSYDTAKQEAVLQGSLRIQDSLYVGDTLIQAANLATAGSGIFEHEVTLQRGTEQSSKLRLLNSGDLRILNGTGSVETWSPALRHVLAEGLAVTACLKEDGSGYAWRGMASWSLGDAAVFTDAQAKLPGHLRLGEADIVAHSPLSLQLPLRVELGLHRTPLQALGHDQLRIPSHLQLGLNGPSLRVDDEGTLELPPALRIGQQPLVEVDGKLAIGAGLRIGQAELVHVPAKKQLQLLDSALCLSHIATPTSTTALQLPETLCIGQVPVQSSTRTGFTLPKGLLTVGQQRLQELQHRGKGYGLLLPSALYFGDGTASDGILYDKTEKRLCLPARLRLGGRGALLQSPHEDLLCVPAQLQLGQHTVLRACGQDGTLEVPPTLRLGPRMQLKAAADGHCLQLPSQLQLGQVRLQALQDSELQSVPKLLLGQAPLQGLSAQALRLPLQLELGNLGAVVEGHGSTLCMPAGQLQLGASLHLQALQRDDKATLQVQPGRLQLGTALVQACGDAVQLSAGLNLFEGAVRCQLRQEGLHLQLPAGGIQLDSLLRIQQLPDRRGTFLDAPAGLQTQACTLQQGLKLAAGKAELAVSRDDTLHLTGPALKAMVLGGANLERLHLQSRRVKFDAACIEVDQLCALESLQAKPGKALRMDCPSGHLSIHAEVGGMTLNASKSVLRLQSRLTELCGKLKACGDIELDCTDAQACRQIKFHHGSMGFVRPDVLKLENSQGGLALHAAGELQVQAGAVSIQGADVLQLSGKRAAYVELKQGEVRQGRVGWLGSGLQVGIENSSGSAAVLRGGKALLDAPVTELPAGAQLRWGGDSCAGLHGKADNTLQLEHAAGKPVATISERGLLLERPATDLQAAVRLDQLLTALLKIPRQVWAQHVTCPGGARRWQQEIQLVTHVPGESLGVSKRAELRMVLQPAVDWQGLESLEIAIKTLRVSVESGEIEDYIYNVPCTRLLLPTQELPSTVTHLDLSVQALSAATKIQSFVVEFQAAAALPRVRLQLALSYLP